MSYKRHNAHPSAGWQSGYAAACKAVDAGSIPTPASILRKRVPRHPFAYLPPLGPGGEIGRRKGLKIPRWQHRAGSSPAPGTILHPSEFSLSVCHWKRNVLRAVMHGYCSGLDRRTDGEGRTQKSRLKAAFVIHQQPVYSISNDCSSTGKLPNAVVFNGSILVLSPVQLVALAIAANADALSD